MIVQATGGSSPPLLRPRPSAPAARAARADRTHCRTGLTTAEREELARKENRELPIPAG
jgi:hypothetical protein